MKRVKADGGVGTAVAHDVADRLRRVTAHQADLATAVMAQGVEEALEGGLVVALGRPHQPAAVVVDHHRQVAVAPLVGDLVDADPAQAVEGVTLGSSLPHHPRHDGPDGGPSDAHHLDDGGLGGVHRQPGHGVVKGPGVAGAVAGPGEGDHRGAVLGAVHPGSVGFEERADLAQVEGPPSSASLAPVVARRWALAATAAALAKPPGAHVGHHRVGLLVELHPLDDRAVIDTEQATPYLDTQHPVLLLASRAVRQLGNVGRRRGADADGLLRYPRMS